MGNRTKLEIIISWEEYLLNKLGSAYGLLVTLVLLVLLVISLFQNWYPIIITENASTYVSVFIALLTLQLQFVAFLANRTVALNENIQNLRKDLLLKPSVSLSTLEACRDDFERRLKSQSMGNFDVEIDHLGLDLTHGWELYKEILRDTLPKANSVKIRILVITDDKSKILPLPQRVKEMCESSSHEMTRIKRNINTLAETLSNHGKSVPLTLEIRRYANLPIIHGMSIKKPFEVRYISMCSWRNSLKEEGDTYDWGRRTYCMIPGGEYPADTLISDQIDVFDGQFTHFWDSGKADAWNFTPRDKGVVVA